MDKEVGVSAGMQEAIGTSRRGLIGGGLLLLASTALNPAGAVTAPWLTGPLRARRAVVAFHADQLYIDHSGQVEPYLPPGGLRSLDGHDEETLARLVYNI
ncbi:MAG: hypothetical protein JWM75_1925 [Sphingomonas bacterium]|nr:hypothetical protein [Sphingomonas bacterium]